MKLVLLFFESFDIIVSCDLKYRMMEPAKQTGIYNALIVQMF